MARVFIDTSVVGKNWFREILPTLLKSEKVRFAYAEHATLANEAENCRRLREIYALAGKLNRRDDADDKECMKRSEILTGHQSWKGEPSCDDPHVFSINFLKPVSYVFTSDLRIAKCRDCLNAKVDKRYCGFSLIASEANYEANKALVHA